MHTLADLMVKNGSSINGNAADIVSSPASLSPLDSRIIRQGASRRLIALNSRCAWTRARSQDGGGAYVHTSATLTVTDGSSIDGNTAGSVSSSAFAIASRLMIKQSIGEPTLDSCERERKFATIALGGDTGRARPRVRSQAGGGVKLYGDSVMTVTDDSSIDDNAALVSLPASLSPLSSWLTREGAIDADLTRDARPRVRSQDGGGAYLLSSSKLTVSDDSHCDGNVASVSLPASLLPLGSWLDCPGACRRSVSLRKRERERDVQRRSHARIKTLCWPACPLAVQRRRSLRGLSKLELFPQYDHPGQPRRVWCGALL